MQVFCLNCNDDCEIEARIEKETYNVKGEKVSIDAKVSYCKECGEQVWNDELDDENIIKAYAEYRRRNGLLQPEKIKSIREKYNLSQVAFARILGLGDKTITRYENGSLQDAAQNNLIELVDVPDNFEKLLNKNIRVISNLDLKKATEALEKLHPRIIYPNDNNLGFTTGISNKYWGGLLKNAK